LLLAAGLRRRLAAGAPLRGPALVGVILLVLAAAYWPTVRELSGLGSRTDGQFLIVFAAFAGLVWGRRHALEEIPLQPFWPGLVGLLALAFAWLVGQIAFVRVLTDASVVLMVPMAILALCGLRWTAALAFPLAFLAFAIPFEQPLAPPLAEWTAEVTIFLLEAVGVPVVREGTYFTIPSGRWVVADACGGVKYLMSASIIAVLLAPALFTSPWKRTAFVLGAVALAIAGNWLRAFLTVLGAHLSNNELLRDDHSTFGWVLYAMLFVLYCMAWWRSRDHPPPTERPSSAKLKAVPDAPAIRILAVAIAALAIALSGPMISSAASAYKSAGLPDGLQVAEANGWTRTSRSATRWRPQLQNVDNPFVQSFHKDGRRVDLFIGMFREENWDAKLVSVANRFVEPGSVWALASRSVAKAEFAGRALNATQALIHGPDTRVVAWQWYWVDGVVTGSGLEAKLEQVRRRLMTGRQESAWISISLEADGTLRSESDLQAFLSEMGPAIDQALSAAARK
jgi:exosortase A